MRRQTIDSRPGAPFSRAVKANGFLFVSGHVGLNLETGHLVEGGIKEQTRQALENLTRIVQSSGSSFQDVVKVTVYLVNIQDFSGMNEVYRKYFSTDPPARTTVGVQELGRKACLVEIDLIAVL